MLDAYEVDGLAQQRFLALDGHLEGGFAEYIRRLLLEIRHLLLAPLLPVLVQPVEIIGQPGRADLEESHPEIGEPDRHALAHHRGEVEQDARREAVAMDLGEGLELAGAPFVGPVAGAVDADGGAEGLGRLIDRIVERIAKPERQAVGDHLEALEPELLGGVLDLGGGRLGVAHRQGAHRVQAVGLIVVGEMGVDGAAGGDGEIELQELADMARSGGEQHRLLDLVVVEDAVPDIDLLLRRQAAVVAVGRLDLAHQVGVPRLEVAGPQRRRPVLEGGVHVTPDFVRILENVPVGVDRRERCRHVVLPCLDCGGTLGAILSRPGAGCPPWPVGALDGGSGGGSSCSPGRSWQNRFGGQGGTPGRIRTYDTRIKSPLFYLAELRALALP